jgi:hypothetical protein
MKKLINLLVFALISANVFCQGDTFDDEALFANEKYGNYLSLDKSTIQYVLPDLDKHIYCFIANDLLYVLAYRIDENEKDWKREYNDKIVNGVCYRKREWMLYYVDKTNNLIEASNVVQTDCRFATVVKDYGTHKSYDESYDLLLQKGLGDGQIRILNNGCVVMLLCNGYRSVGIDYDKEYRYNVVVIFVPNGDGTYTSTRFEPLNKKPRELCANDTLIISESENRIKLEFWNKMICDENEIPDGYSTYNSDTNDKIIKIPYKREFIATLNFDLYGKKVCYSGNFDLFQKND